MSIRRIKSNPLLICLVCGLILGLSQPLVISWLSSKPIDPTGLSGLLAFVGFIPLLILLPRVSLPKAFALGFGTSFVLHNVINAHWLISSLHFVRKVPDGQTAIAVELIMVLLAGYIGFAAFVSAWLLRKHQWPLWWSWPMTLSVMEFARNYTPFNGGPFGNIGNSLATIPILAQGASLVGVYGLVFGVGLVNGCLTEAFQNRTKWFRLAAVWVGTAFVALWVGYGVWRLASFDSRQFPSMRVALIQGNIEQGVINQGQLYSNDILDKYHELTKQAALQRPDLVVWPEGAYPLPMSLNKPIPSALRDWPAPALVGVIAKDGRGFTNSAISLTADGKLTDRIDKSHLLPFGEYVPWPYNSWLEPVAIGTDGMHPGEGKKILEVALPNGRKLKTGTNICFENHFPEINRGFVRQGAQLLLTLTNDAWYGISSAPYHHVSMSILRAIEGGRSFVRVANTGISAFIDARGTVYRQTELFKNQIVVADVRLINETTLYTIIGDALPITCLLMLFGVILLHAIKNLGLILDSRQLTLDRRRRE